MDAHELTNRTTGTTVTLKRRRGLARRVGRLVLWLVAAVFLSLFWAGLLPVLGIGTIGTTVVATVMFTVVTVVLLAAVARATGSTRVVWGAFLLGLLGLLLRAGTVFV